jgi:hypothetical protein
MRETQVPLSTFRVFVAELAVLVAGIVAIARRYVAKLPVTTIDRGIRARDLFAGFRFRRARVTRAAIAIFGAAWQALAFETIRFDRTLRRGGAAEFDALPLLADLAESARSAFITFERGCAATRRSDRDGHHREQR